MKAMAQERDEKTRDRILRAAIETIELHGERALRIDDIATMTGVTVGSIYHHFTNREGLVTEALVARFVGAYDVASDEAIQQLVPPTNREEFQTFLSALFLSWFNPQRASQRHMRISALASAAGNPEFAQRVIAAETSRGEVFQLFLEDAQAKGWIRSDINVRAWGLWAIGATIGRYFIEMGDTGIDPHEWDRVAILGIVDTLFR